MSEISEIEIKSMTKEQNYIRGYKDGKNDVLEKIRAEITAIAINGQVDEHTAFIRTGEQVKQMVLDIIDKQKVKDKICK